MSSEEEELYFAQHEQDLRAEKRHQMAMAARDIEEQRKIAQSAGTDNVEVAARIKALGFDGDSARVFDLLPLVHVAWADGKIQRGERAAILKVLASRGVERDSEAFRTMESLLEEKPSDAFMRESLSVLREVTGGLGERASSIVDLCIQVAASAGGFLGLKLGQKIGDEEKKQIETVLHSLGPDASKSFQNGLDS
jgi:tellurite resistance protein